MSDASYLFPIFSLTIGFLAIAILFFDLWHEKFHDLYPVIWGLLVVLALPTQTYFMLINTGYSFIWIIDAILIIPLTITLSTKIASLLFHAIGLIIAITIASITPFEALHIPADLGYWSLLMHSIVLMLCFALFRKRDVELCRFELATIAHETRRTLNVFYSTADFYKSSLPLFVPSHSTEPLTESKRLSQRELDLLLSTPEKIQTLAQRTRDLLTNYIDRMSSYSTGRTLTKNCSIKECILAAICDASLTERTKAAIKFSSDSDINIKGDREQLIQVFINMLENAGHATLSVASPSISINIMGNTVFVTDNGCGINTANLPNIFDEFFSTKSSNGHGLAFCKTVMIEHGGSLMCTSKENSFTRFELRFTPAN